MLLHCFARSGSDVSQNNDAINGHHQSEGQLSSEGAQNSADVATQTSLEEPNMCNGHAVHNNGTVENNGTESDMERALEHQAQFIAQYEDEEKVQREWEDKFRENNGSTPVCPVCSLVFCSCLGGNFGLYTYEWVFPTYIISLVGETCEINRIN